MGSYSHDRPFPRGALIGAAALIAFSLLATYASRTTGVGTSEVPESQPLISRNLVILDRPDGGVLVRDADAGRTVTVLAPETNGFVRGVMRSVARHRKLNDVGKEPPIRLTLWEDGRLSLYDATTGYRVYLEAFGPTNADAFANFLEIDHAWN